MGEGYTTIPSVPCSFPPSLSDWLGCLIERTQPANGKRPSVPRPGWKRRHWLKRPVSPRGGRQDDGAQVGARGPAAALRGGAGALCLRLARGDFQGAGRRLPGHVRHQRRHQLLPRLHLQVGSWFWLGGRSSGTSQPLQPAKQYFWDYFLHSADTSGFLQPRTGSYRSSGLFTCLHCWISLLGLHPLLCAPRLLCDLHQHLCPQLCPPVHQLQAPRLPQPSTAAKDESQEALNTMSSWPGQSLDLVFEDDQVGLHSLETISIFFAQRVMFFSMSLTVLRTPNISAI